MFDPVTGKRCDAASRHLLPESGNPNLGIVVGKHVKCVIIERAIGIEYGMEGSGELTTANASKLAVVSTGKISSPSIMERSEIGGTPILEKFSIPMLVDLPGVGENYNLGQVQYNGIILNFDDLWVIHFTGNFGADSAYQASDYLDFMTDVWSDLNAYNVHLREERGSGRVALSGIKAIAKMRPTAAELATASPALKQRWETFFAPPPDKTMSMVVPFTGSPVARDQKYVTVEYFLVRMHVAYLDLKGSVHITSGEDTNAPLDFRPSYCSEVCDIEQLGFMYKLTRELYRRSPAYRAKVAARHPSFHPAVLLHAKETNGPLSIYAPNIVHSLEDDKAITNYHKDTVSATWHSLGTCAMKACEQGGVVDARLNVHGVEGLKVAGLSICPSDVRNTRHPLSHKVLVCLEDVDYPSLEYITALVVGKKAAVIIAEDLGLKL